MSKLLVLADAYLAAATPGRVRQTCWIARRGLEQIVDRLVQSRRLEMPEVAPV